MVNQKINIRTFEAFAGYGSQHSALSRIKEKYDDLFDFEIVGISEVEKNAIKAYNAIHGEVVNFGDISKIEISQLPDFDLFTYSFPCTDISVCGKRAGFTEGSGTRSSLLWECKKIITGKKPKYLLLENVKNLISKDNLPLFEVWISWLKDQGYTTYYKMLNSKDFGVAQSRERVFAISILGEHEPYIFPEGNNKVSILDDILEKEPVDDKWYTSWNFYYQKKVLNTTPKETCLPCCDNYVKEMELHTNKMNSYYNEQITEGIDNVAFRELMNRKLKEVGITYKDIAMHLGIKATTRIKKWFTEEDYYPNLKEWQKIKELLHIETDVFDQLGNPKLRAAKFEMRNAIKHHSGINGTLLSNDSISAVQIPRLRFEEGIEYHECSPIRPDLGDALTPEEGNVKWCNNCKYFEQRLLTPREFWRLMDMTDEDFDKAQASGISDRMLCKLAGNSIVVGVLESLFENMFIPKELQKQT